MHVLNNEIGIGRQNTTTVPTNSMALISDSALSLKSQPADKIPVTLKTPSKRGMAVLNN
jgi:hypothetical protein